MRSFVLQPKSLGRVFIHLSVHPTFRILKHIVFTADIFTGVLFFLKPKHRGSPWSDFISP